MTLPRYPAEPAGGWEQPGLYPLRPLTIGEIFAAAFRVARRHAGVLVPAALLSATLVAAANLGVLSLTVGLRSYATTMLQVGGTAPAANDYAQLSAATRLLGQVLVGLSAGVLVSLICAPIISGLAAPLVAEGATTRTGSTPKALTRMAGRWQVLVGTAALVGALEAVGLVLLIVPGFLLWVALLPAGPIAAMEGTRPMVTVRRAAALSRNSRGRLFGVSLLAAVLAGAVSVFASRLLTSVIGSSDQVTALLLGQGLSVLIGAVTGAWIGCVTAVLYVDLRMRRENLGEALRRYTRAV